jgi:hypothetical protein
MWLVAPDGLVQLYPPRITLGRQAAVPHPIGGMLKLDAIRTLKLAKDVG